MDLTTLKKWSGKAFAGFLNDNSEPTLNIEGVVEIAGVSDLNVDVNSVNSSCYIGKSAALTNGDFIAEFSALGTITFSGYPADISAITAGDIESVRQINAAGSVVATYHRDDVVMTMAGAVLTVSGAAFLITDVFVVFTNIPVQAKFDVITGTTYVGKAVAATDEDFTTAYASGTTITLGAFPSGITAFIADDIEFVRRINVSGVLIHTHTRANSTFTMPAGVLTIAEGNFAADDTFIVVTNVPKPAAGSSLIGAAGGKNIYTNMSGDFTATPTNGAATITITALPFTLEAIHVASIYKIAVTTNIRSVVPLTAISVAGGVITVSDADNFATGDVVQVTLIGPDKAYDVSLDNDLTSVQNPDYAHTTSVETLINEDDPVGTNLTADAGGGATTLVDATGAFTVASTAVGYLAHNITESTSALVTTVDSTTQITTGAGVTDWSSDEYQLPLVKRYEINADTYNFLTLHYRLTAIAAQNVYLKIYGTLDASATVDADTNWVNLSTEILGNADGINQNGVGTLEDTIIIDTPSTMLKYMVKFVIEKSTTGAPTGSLFNVFIKKSS